MNLTADSLKIDTDEGRFVLIVDTAEIGAMTIDIHALALEFESEVRRELRPYALEADYARTAVASGVPLPVFTKTVSVEDAIEAGYALDDPKSDGWHDRVSSIYDNRRGK